MSDHRATLRSTGSPPVAKMTTPFFFDFAPAAGVEQCVTLDADSDRERMR
ncbi:hypothetical protein [Burkholderia cenocepacia]|nr:hypothetical protein [Burkholderia cenocepacia]MDS0845977.1 hypothetical protein [Burkholderia cenocepacia]